MKYGLIEKENGRYINYSAPEAPIHSVQDALDLVAACMENNTEFVMLHGDSLADDFYKLRTGLAGEIVQKFVNNYVKVAVVITEKQRIIGKFKEFLTESNRGNAFRVFHNSNDAEDWLFSLNK